MKGRPIQSIKVIHCSVSQVKISTAEENGAVYLIDITGIQGHVWLLLSSICRLGWIRDIKNTENSMDQLQAHTTEHV